MPAAVYISLRAGTTAEGQDISFVSHGKLGDVWRRFFGMALIGGMPEDGVAEALTSLIDIYNFHIESSQFQLVEPQNIPTGVGTIASAAKSSDLFISE